MTLLRSAPLGVQEPSLWVLPPSHGNAAQEAVELAEQVGLFLDPWQVIGLEAILGETDTGAWSAFESAIVVSRQNGKGGILEARELAGLFLFDEMDIVHSAHEAKTSKEAFRRMERYIRASPVLFARVGEEGFKRSNEEVSITVRDTGARLRYLTRSSGGGRGFTADVLVLDEAYNLPAEMMAAILPIISARPNPQVIYTSSAGLSSSVVLWGLRKRAMAGGDASLAFCEWTAERPAFDSKGKVVSPPVDPDDRGNWLASSPSIGVDRSDGSGLSISAIENEQRAMSETPEQFLRERLGVWDPILDDVEKKLVKIPKDKWMAPAVWLPKAQVRKRWPKATTLAFDVSRDGEWSSISTGAGTITEPFVQCIDHRQGVGWLPAALVDWVEKIDPPAIGYNSAGPVVSQIAAIIEAFIPAGIDINLLRPFVAGDYKASCAGLYLDVVEGRLFHPRHGQGPLDRAALDATERTLVDAFAWAQRSEPISPLTSATLARALLPVEAVADKPVFMY